MRRLLPRVTGLAAAAGLAVAGLAVTAGPAAASACAGSTGVTVVVDTGTSVSTRCASGPSGSALTALAAVASVEQVQTQPGFVCRIDGFPASDPCVRTPPATAYWAFFHAERGGSWTYSSQGAGSYAPAAGSVIGFAFGAGSAPRTAPPAPASTSTPATTTAARSPTPTTRSTNRPAPTTDRTSGGVAATPPASTPSRTVTATPSPTTSPAPTATAPPTPSGGPSPVEGALASEPQASSSGGVGTLVVAGALLVLVGGLAAWIARRRRSAG